MRIALLNLPIDNNYGGNLQRYALMKVLQEMGHDVTHIRLQSRARLKWYMVPLVYAKRILSVFVFRKQMVLNQEAQSNADYEKRLAVVLPFYEHYIKHTGVCNTASDIKRLTKGKYDAFIVGSDQCWRKEMCDAIGWEPFLFGFLRNDKSRRVAYGVSFGKGSGTYNNREKEEFRRLYGKFTAVSVREKSGLQVLNRMGCVTPTPRQVLDPTLLLNRHDYLKLMESIKNPSPAKGKVFCYVLDKTIQIEIIAREIADELETEPVFYGIYGGNDLSIEMWLKSIYEASYIVTDSYHGVVFSVIFKKPFKYCGNERRGNDRVISLFQTLDITDVMDYDVIQQNVKKWRINSLLFLSDSLK